MFVDATIRRWYSFYRLRSYSRGHHFYEGSGLGGNQMSSLYPVKVRPIDSNLYEIEATVYYEGEDIMVKCWSPKSEGWTIDFRTTSMPHKAIVSLMHDGKVHATTQRIF